MKNGRRMTGILLALLTAAALALPTQAADEETASAETEPAADGQWVKLPSCSSVTLENSAGEAAIVAGKMTSKQTVTIWTEKELDEEAQSAVEALVRQQSGIGNPKNVIFISGNGSENLGMTVDHDEIVFTRPSDWSMIYIGRYPAASPSPSAKPGTPTATPAPTGKPTVSPSPSAKATATPTPSAKPGTPTASPAPSTKPTASPTPAAKPDKTPTDAPDKGGDKQPDGPLNDRPDFVPDYVPETVPDGVENPPDTPELPPVTGKTVRRGAGTLKTVREAIASTGKTELYDVRATASGGDTAEYRVMTVFPMRGGELPEEYRIEDTLAAGLRYVPDSLTIGFYRRADEKTPLVSWEKGDYTAEFAETETGSTMTVRAEKAGLDKLVGAGRELLIVIRYDAVLQSGDTVLCTGDGNENTVTLAWRFRGDAAERTLTDTCYVLTGEVSLRPILRSAWTMPQTGTAVLYNAADGVYLTLREEDGVWYVTGCTDSAESATALPLDGEEPITVRGIEDDLYRIEAGNASVSFRLNP